MDSLFDLWPMILLLLATGLAAGIMAGLLGVGGGIIMVPAIEYAMAVMEVDPAVRMHIAVATSLAIIIPTSVSSSRAHHRRGGVDTAIARGWAVAILVGAVLGTLLASRLEGDVLALLFGVVAILVAIKLALPLDHYRLQRLDWRSPAIQVVPLSIGGLSAMIGIGGGTFSVPSLTLLGVPMHRAVGTSALFGLLISLPAALSYVWTGWGDPRLPPGSLGYVSTYGIACIAPMTMLAAPWGASLAHRLSPRILSVLFATFLLTVGVRMLYRALT